MKILLVDDTSFMRKMQKNALNQMGYTEILEAANGLDAMERVESHRDIALIILDWNMPGMNGINTLKALKAEDATKNIPVIMATSEAKRECVLEAARSGAAKYIIIPFNSKEFRTKINAVLKQERVSV